MCYFGRNQRWQPVTVSRYDITHISACMHDSNEIPTAIPMFSGSDNETRQLWRLPDVLKMAHTNFRVTDAIFSSQLVHTSGSLCSSLVVLPDPENMGVAVGISLLSCAQVELRVLTFCGPPS